ncbi:unnamed protein product, partial [Rotaria sp. Silwood2]
MSSITIIPTSSSSSSSTSSSNFLAKINLPPFHPAYLG